MILNTLSEPHSCSACHERIGYDQTRYDPILSYKILSYPIKSKIRNQSRPEPSKSDQIRSDPARSARCPHLPGSRLLFRRIDAGAEHGGLPLVSHDDRPEPGQTRGSRLNPKLCSTMRRRAHQPSAACSGGSLRAWRWTGCNEERNGLRN